MTIDAIGLGLCTVDMLFVVDRQPTFDTTMRASQYLRQGGGPVPTSLVALARLGASTSYVGKIGDDPDGDFIRAELEKEGVDTSSFVVVPGGLTRVALVLVEEATGERGFTTRPETCADLNPAESTAKPSPTPVSSTLTTPTRPACRPPAGRAKPVIP